MCDYGLFVRFDSGLVSMYPPISHTGKKEDLSLRLVTHHTSDCSSNSISSSTIHDDCDDVSDVEVIDPWIGRKFDKMFKNDEGVTSSYTGVIKSRDEVDGKYLYRIEYNDGDSEEMWRKDLLQLMNVEDYSDDESEWSVSDSDDDSD